MARRQYPVLEQKMREQKIKRPDIGRLIGKGQNALCDRMSGKRSFTLQEAVLIRDTFFPEWTVDELFKQ